MEIRRLLVRSLRRPVLTLAIASLLTAAFLGWQIRRPPRFPVHAELLIRENALSSDRQSLSRADMRSFVENVAFTSAHLQRIIDRHHLYRQAVVRSPVLALLEMRKDIEVEILQDYFAEYRLDNSAQRSVRIVVTFTGDDPLEASAVAQDLGELVAQAELGRHADRARRNARLARVAAERIRQDVKEAADSLALLEMHLAANTDRELSQASEQLKRALLQARMDQLEARRSEAEQQETLFDLTAESEARQAGTRVHLAPLQTDLGIEQDASRWLKRRAATSGLLGIGLALVLVGAFNPRLYDADDVRRAGGWSLGALRKAPRRGDG
jgi:hypothetical protein